MFIESRKANLPISVTPTTSGTITSCVAVPALPVGLSLGTTNCNITGTPTTAQASTSYTITASNMHGSGSTSISITINYPTVYTATEFGLSISTDGGGSFTNRTMAQGLGSIDVKGVYVQWRLWH